jgi:TonB family C-terminal domain
MSFFSDTRETSARYGTYITEFRDLCKRHELSYGTAEDFFRLAPKLAHDERFRDDFCQLAKSVTQRENGRVTLTRILTIIAIAMGGDSVDTIGTAGAVPVSLVVVFLAGVGGWSESEPDLRSATSESIAMSSPGMGMAAKDEQEALELERRLSAEPNNIGEVTASLFGGPALVKDALSRLELNTLQLKMHLDSIDSRMNRIEPHLDDLSTRLTIDTSHHTNGVQHAKAKLPEIRYSQPELRIAPQEDIFRAASVVTRRAVEPVAPVEVRSPAAARAPVEGMRPGAIARAFMNEFEFRWSQPVIIAVGILFATIAGVLGTLLYLVHENQVKGEINRLVATTMDASARTTSSPLPPANVAEAIVIPVLPADTARSSRQNALDSLVGDTSQQIKLPSNDVTTSGPYHAQRKVVNANRPEDETRNSLTTSLINIQPTDDLAAKLVDADITSAANASDLRTKIFVPASTLARNAVSSPPPAYPPQARKQHIEGDVLLQASISERGRVETVVVVNGPEALRAAAVDALSNWRFRPYVVDGRPVPVRTFIDFQFKLNQ